MSNPQKVPNIVVSLLNRPKEQAIAYVNASTKDSSEYMFRLANDNIVSFSHSYNFDKGDGDNIGNLITLELVDPENVFEYTIFSNYDLLTKNQNEIAEMRKESISELNRLIQIRNKLKDYFNSVTTKTITKSVDLYIKTGSGAGNSQYIVKSDSASQRELQSLVIEDISAGIKNILPNDPQNLNKDDFTKKIISVLQEGGYVSFSYDKKDSIGTSKKTIDASAVIASGTFDNILSDLNLDNLEQKLQITPTPYFYFYYGLNDNPNEWTGPISAQFTDAKYNYSYESGRKSITMNFTTTFDWPAFSKLALDVRGFTTTLAPIYRKLNVIQLQTLQTTQATPGDYNTILTELISEYIKRATSKDTQVLVLLPDLNTILKNSFENYAASLELEGGNPYSQEAYRIDAYARLLDDMGFSTNYFVDDINIPPGGQINTQKTVTKNFRGFAQGSLTDQAALFSFNNPNTFLTLGVGIGKDITQSFRDPLQKIIVGIKNKTAIIDPTFEVIDDQQFVKEFIGHLNSINSPYAQKFKNANSPIVIFGDRYLIEKYLYGKKFYILNGIVQEGRTTTEAKDLTQPLADFNSYVARAVANNSGDDLLSQDMKGIFNDDYIKKIASKYFLKVETCQKVNSSLYTSPTDVLALPTVTESLKVARIPIFKSGVKESNVLNIDLNFNDFYFVALKSVWSQSETLNLVSNDSPNTPSVNTNQLNSFTLDELDRIKKQAKEISIAKNKDLDIVKLFQFIDKDSGFTDFKNKTDVEKGEQLELLLKFIQQENQNLKIIVGSHENTNSYLTMLSLFSTLVNRAYQGVVKTLPFFHISGTALSTPPILLLLEEVNTPPYTSKGFITRALNGLYQIRGFKHTISTEDICSEFYIVKSIQLDMPIAFGGRGQ